MFEEIIKKKNGAKFLALDACVFTPASPFYKISSQGEVRDEIVRIVENLIKKEIDLVFLADENLGLEERGGAEVQRIFKEEAEKQGITVYPGFTVITKEGDDVIFVFSPDSQPEEMDELLSFLGLSKGERFYRNNRPVPLGIATSQLKEKRMKECLMLYVKTNEKVEEFLDGVVCKKPFPTALLGSFARTPEEVGKVKTYVKIAERTIEGMRIALLDPEVKIRYEPTEIKHSRIVGAIWKGGFLDGVEVHFNPNFNVLMGGRGTGKTTMIESIRYALGILPRTERNRRMNEQILKEVVKPGSKITLIVETEYPAKKRYRIERIYPFKPAVYDDETQEKLDISPTDVFQAEIYGSKEIFEISKKPDFQYELIRQKCMDKLMPIEEKIERILKEIKEIDETMERLEKELKDKEKDISKAPAVKEKIKKFEELGIPEKIRKKRKVEEERFLFEKSLEKLDETAKKLAEMVTEIIPSFGSITEKIKEKAPPGPVEEYTRYLNESIQEFGRFFNDAIEVLKKARNKNQEDRKRWEEESLKIEEEYRESLRKLQEDYPGIDVEEYIQLENELKELTEKEKEVEAMRNKLSMLSEDRRKKLGEFSEARKEETRIIKERIEEWNNALSGRIKIEFDDKNPPFVFKKLKEIFPEVREDVLEKLSQRMYPSEIASVLRERDYERLNALGIPAAEIARYKEFQDLVRIKRMETLYYPPLITFYLNLKDPKEPLWKSVDKLSDGQRCTVILEFLLLSGNAPLVVDQPEEDMDNLYIVKEIVKKIRKEKDKRQFIFATHNANLPVIGDADLFLCLEADTQKAYLKEGNYGYLDSKNIKKLVYDYLEGGKDALQARVKKYGEPF